MRTSSLPATETDCERSSLASYANDIQRLFRSLSTARLTASAYRVLADTLARMIEHRIDTETVSVTWMASRLGMHPNSVSKAYAELVRARMLSRTVVAFRGAPTRTTLCGIPRALVSSVARDRGNTTRAYDPPSSLESHESVAADQFTDAQAKRLLYNKCAEPDTKRILSSVDTESRDAVRRRDLAPGPRPDVEPRPPRLPVDPVVRARVERKVPTEYIHAAMQARDPDALLVLDEWGLTETEVAEYRKYPPGPDAFKPVPCTSVAGNRHKECEVVAIQPDVLTAARAAKARLGRMIQDGAIAAASASRTLDEIAYSAQTGQLGGGNVKFGINAGLAIARRGGWTTPRGFPESWYGIVDRVGAVTPESAHTQVDDTQESVSYNRALRSVGKSSHNNTSRYDVRASTVVVGFTAATATAGALDVLRRAEGRRRAP